jgi:hypothetical protein
MQLNSGMGLRWMRRIYPGIVELIYAILVV